MAVSSCEDTNKPPAFIRGTEFFLPGQEPCISEGRLHHWVTVSLEMFRTTLRWQTSGQTYTITPFHPFLSALHYHKSQKSVSVTLRQATVWFKLMNSGHRTWLVQHLQITWGTLQLDENGWRPYQLVKSILTIQKGMRTDRPTFTSSLSLSSVSRFINFPSPELVQQLLLMSVRWMSLLVKVSWVPVSAHWPATLPKVFVIDWVSPD